METIEKVVYINLEHRTDRKEQVENELLKCFPSEKILRIDAIKDAKGGIGCSLSHISALEVAISNNWENVLIVEDDLQWRNFENGVEILKKLTKNPYDVILLNGIDIYYNPETFALNQCCARTAYLVNKTYFKALLNNYKEGVELLKKEYIVKYRGDRYWNSLQKKDKWYIIPDMCIQRPSFSDIEKRDVDYTMCIFPKKFRFNFKVRPNISISNPIIVPT